jgi:transposase
VALAASAPSTAATTAPRAGSARAPLTISCPSGQQTPGDPCPVSDLFGHAGRELLDRMEIPDPWRSNVDVSLGLIDDLDLRIAELTVQLKRQGADHRYIPVLVTAPGIGWINAYTIASEIGDTGRFSSPARFCGYTGLCPRVKQSGAVDARGPISKHGPKYLRGRRLRPH